MEPARVFYNICKKEKENSTNYCANYVKYVIIIRISEFFGKD